MKTEFGLLTDRADYSHSIENLSLEFGVITSNPRFPNTGFVRISAIIAPDGPIPVSKSTWWEGVRDGRFPAPVKLGPKTTTWRVEDILALIERVGATGGGQ
jgi:predicted DNA-binding transcriptional regulator AlpA